MGTVNVTLGDGKKLNLILGQQLENAVTAVVFDFSAWQTEFGSGTLGLSVQRHGDTQPYAVVPTVSGTNATWNISELDTAYKGVGEVQVTYTVGSVVKKSTVYKFTVYRSLGENGEYPSPGQTWQEEIEDELADVKQDLSNRVGLYDPIVYDKLNMVQGSWYTPHGLNNATGRRRLPNWVDVDRPIKLTWHLDTATGINIANYDGTDSGYATDVTYTTDGSIVLPLFGKYMIVFLGSESTLDNGNNYVIVETASEYITTPNYGREIYEVRYFDWFERLNPNNHQYWSTTNFFKVKKGDLVTMNCHRVLKDGSKNGWSLRLYDNDFNYVKRVPTSDTYVQNSYIVEDGISYVIFSMKWNPNTIDIGFFDNSVIDTYDMPDTNIYNSVMDKQDIIYIRDDGPLQSWKSSDFIRFNNKKSMKLLNFIPHYGHIGQMGVITFDENKNIINEVMINMNSSTTQPYDIVPNFEDIIFNNCVRYIRFVGNTNLKNGMCLIPTNITTYVFVPYLYDWQKKSSLEENIRFPCKDGINNLREFTNYPWYPHGSKYAFLASVYQGFNSFMIHIIYTSDGVPVVGHNDNISGWLSDGDSDIYIRQNTYEDLLQYDVGEKWGTIYEGTHITTLSEMLAFLKPFNGKIEIEPVYIMSQTERQTLYKTIKESGIPSKDICVFSYRLDFVNEFFTALPNAQLMYWVDTNFESQLNQIATLNSTVNGEVLVCGYYSDLSNYTDLLINLNLHTALGTPTTEPDTVVSWMKDSEFMTTCVRIGTQLIPAWKIYQDGINEMM